MIHVDFRPAENAMRGGEGDGGGRGCVRFLAPSFFYYVVFARRRRRLCPLEATWLLLRTAP